jgi:hypothetical protein
MLGFESNIGRSVEQSIDSITLPRGTYFEHVESDLLATTSVIQSGGMLPQFGRRLFLNRKNQLRDFGDSWLFNGIGVSTLAFTVDGKLLTVEQSEHNVNSSQLLAPAGSGALEPQDAVNLDELRAVALAGAHRELQEETGVCSGEIGESYVLGFGRWLNKAGRPEFYAVTFLAADSHELARRPIPRTDVKFVKRRRFDRLPATRDIWMKGVVELLPEVHDVLSVPLAACLQLLVDALEVDSELVAQLARAGILDD